MHPNTMPVFTAHAHWYCQSFNKKNENRKKPLDFYSRISCLPIIPFSCEQTNKIKWFEHLFMSRQMFSKCWIDPAAACGKIYNHFCFVIIMLYRWFSIVGYKRSKSKVSTSSHTHTCHTIAATCISDFSSLVFYSYFIYWFWIKCWCSRKIDQCLRFKNIERCLI